MNRDTWLARADGKTVTLGEFTSRSQAFAYACKRGLRMQWLVSGDDLRQWFNTPPRTSRHVYDYRR